MLDRHAVKSRPTWHEILGPACRETVDRHRVNYAIDVVVADYHLGGGETGMQVIERIRESLGAQLGAVLMTGDTSGAIRDLPHHPNLRVVSKPTRPMSY
jgi:hypothetical protein